jgi:hypothetical protein
MAFCPALLFALAQNILEPSCVYAKVGLFGKAEAKFAKNPQAAYATYRKAVLLDPLEGRSLVERCEVGEKLKLPLAEQLTLLEQPPDAVKRWDDLTTSLQFHNRTRIPRPWQNKFGNYTWKV